MTTMKTMSATNTSKTLAVAALSGLLLVAGACSDGDDPAAPDPDAPALLGVEPQGGALGVDRNTSVQVEFDHVMMAGMEEYADLHEGDVTGPEVPGSWAMSDDRTRMTFTPDAPLKATTDYTVHLGGGMMGADGHHVNFEEHGGHMGGQWATSGMMQGGQGGMGGGHMGDQGYHMGDGWQHANGSYGMVFTFTTGG